MKIYLLAQLLVAYLAVVMLTGCGNMRIYFGVDDYGEAKEFHHDFKTRGNNDGDRTLGQPNNKRY